MTHTTVSLLHRCRGNWCRHEPCLDEVCEVSAASASLVKSLATQTLPVAASALSCFVMLSITERFPMFFLNESRFLLSAEKHRIETPVRSISNYDRFYFYFVSIGGLVSSLYDKTGTWVQCKSITVKITDCSSFPAFAYLRVRWRLHVCECKEL